MAITDLVVDWFPLIFGSSFLITALVMQIRKMGHLKLGRDPKKGELVAILLIFGFNILIAFPVLIIGLLIEYTVGAPSIVIVILSAVMMLADLIPVLLSGMVAYFILSGVYEQWGISAVASIVTGILLLLIELDIMGWLESATPFIIDMIGTLIGTEFVGLIMLVALAVCLGKCTKNQEPNESKEQPKTNLGNLSTESGLRLLVGLGRRIINDSDDEAFDALKHIYEFNVYSKKLLDQSASEIDFNVNSSLSRNDRGSVNQTFDVFNERFGKIKKWTYNLILAFIVVSISSAVLVVPLFNRGLFIFMILSELAIMLPIISGVIYKFSSRYEHRRYSAPRVNQYNSYLLTNKEFRNRVIFERGLFGLCALSLLGIVVEAIFGMIPSAVLWMIISGAVLVAAAAFSTKDRILKSERLHVSDIVERGLRFIGLSESEEDTEMHVEQPPVLQEKEFPENRERGIIEQDWRKLLEQRGHTEFAKRVADHEREVYLETRDTIYYLAPGAAMVFIGILTVTLFSEFKFLSQMIFLSLGLIIVGSPLLIYGIYRYLKMYQSTRFHKLHRKQLTLLLSHFDIVIQKISSFGSLTDMHGPSEYINFGLVQAFLPSIIRNSIIKLRNCVTFPKKEIDKIWKTRSSYPKLESIGLIGSFLVLILVYQYAFPVMTMYFPDILAFFFLGIIVYLILTMIYAMALYYREKHQLMEIINSQRYDTNITYQETMDSLITLIQSEFTLPLRVLFVGDYPQVTYTGRSLFTTTMVELKEAVIIPQGMRVD